MIETNAATRAERLAVAWEVGALLLSDARWHTWDSTVVAMADAADLRPRDCAPLLTDACRAGHLIRQAVAGDRCVRATPEGQAARPELRVLTAGGVFR